VQQGKKEHDTYLEYRTMEKLGGKIQFMKWSGALMPWHSTIFFYLLTSFSNIVLANALLSQINTQTTLHPGGIRTRAFCSRGGCDVHCATPPCHPGQLLDFYGAMLCW
jgi:hypothetical protein